MTNPLPPLADTPDTPYYAVVFTSVASEDGEGYDAMAERMLTLAAEQPGFLGVESVHDESGVGITVSYWRDRESIDRWANDAKHREAQRLGRERWYASFRLRVCRVERQTSFG